MCIISLAFLIAACGGEPTQTDPAHGLRRAKSELDRIHHEHLKMAVDSVEHTLASMQETGYQEWIPSTTVPRLVETMNAANIAMPGEPKPPGPKMTYVAGSATGKWQVVLIPDDANSTIKLQGFDENLDTPFVEKTITVSRY